MIEAIENRTNGFRTDKAPLPGDANFRRLSSDFPKTKQEYLQKLSGMEVERYSKDVRSLGFEGLLALNEHLRLFLNPTLRGQEIPRGDGQVDVIVPGFKVGSWVYGLTRFCERSHGYSPVDFPVKNNSNDQPMRQEVRNLVDFGKFKKAQTGRKSIFSGHSRGALMIYAAWLRYQKEMEECSEHFMFVGAGIPESGDSVNLIIGAVYVASQYFNKDDDFKFMQELIKEIGDSDELPLPDKVKVTSIVARNDPILKGRTMTKPEDHFVVPGAATHSGLLANPTSLVIKLQRMANNHSQTA